MVDAGTSDEGVFRRSAMSRVASADELDHYIKVTNPSAWIVTLAALLLIGGVLVWALTATVPVTIETTGIVPVGENQEDTTVLCVIDKATANRIQERGARALIEGAETTSVELKETPLSASEVLSLLGSDFYADSIDIHDWNYLLVINLPEAPPHTDFEIGGYGFQAHLVPVSLIVTETRPINIISGNLD